MYITITFDERGNPFEVFSVLGKAGGCDAAQLEAISRLASLALRSGVNVTQVIDQLKGITCHPVWDAGVQILSTPDAVALALSRHATQDHDLTERDHDGDWSAQYPLVSSDATEGNGHHSPDRMDSTRPRCPECFDPMAVEEGCLKCYGCGYSTC
jgi:ribonucleoside-diphosphate reductase alpha chain